MIFEIIQELGADRSRLYKEAILKREVNNELLKRVFRYALDPLSSFGFARFRNRRFPINRLQP